jgi:hypothetical protein
MQVTALLCLSGDLHPMSHQMSMEAEDEEPSRPGFYPVGCFVRFHLKKGDKG